MKQKFFGNKIEEDDFIKDELGTEKINIKKLAANELEFYSPSDKFSARNLNRPILETYEDVENIYEVLQTVCKTLYGQNECGIIPDVFEELNPDYLKIGKYLDNSKRYIRIPSGVFTAKLSDEQAKYYKYTTEEDNQYSRDFFVDNDRNAITIFNKPNTDMFERQLAEHFNFNLNDQDNDIRLYYEIETLKDDLNLLPINPSDSEETKEYNQHENNKRKYNLKNRLKYYIEVSKTAYQYNPKENGETVIISKPEASRVPIDPNLYCANSFELINQFYNSFGNYLTKKDDMFSLEEVIEIPFNNNWKSGKYIIFFNPETKKKVTDSQISYSFSNRFGLISAENYVNKFGNNNQKVIKIFEFFLLIKHNDSDSLWNDEGTRVAGNQDYQELVAEGIECTEGETAPVCCIKKIDRTTLTIKNIDLKNVLNGLVIETRGEKNINISEAHIKPTAFETDNISIGFNSLGYTDGRDRETNFSGDKIALGKNNIAIGTGALKRINTNGENFPTDNIAIGKNTLENNVGNNNIEIGFGLSSTSKTNGLINIGKNIRANFSTIDEKNNIIGNENLIEKSRINIGKQNTIIGSNNNVAIIKDKNTIIGVNNALPNNDNSCEENIIIGNDNGNIEADSNELQLRTGKENIIIGTDNNTNSGDGNYVIGKNNGNSNTQDLNNNSNNKVFGDSNSAYKSSNTIIGNLNVANGTSNTMFGNSNQTSEEGASNTMLGNSNIANGASNTIIGDSNQTPGISNFVIGEHNEISSNYSKFFGNRNKSIEDLDNVVVIGNNNIISNNKNGNSIIINNNFETHAGIKNSLVLGSVSNDKEDKTEAELLIGPLSVTKYYEEFDPRYDNNDNNINYSIQKNYLIKYNNGKCDIYNIVTNFHNFKTYFKGKVVGEWDIHSERSLTQNSYPVAIDNSTGIDEMVPLAGKIGINTITKAALINRKTFIGSYGAKTNTDDSNPSGYVISIRDANGRVFNKTNDNGTFLENPNYFYLNFDTSKKQLYYNSSIFNKDDNEAESREIITNAGNQTIKGNLTLTGDIVCNTLTTTSARKYKTDIVPTNYNAVEEINKINIVNFFYKNDEKKENPKIGFIADDTDSIFSTKEKNSMDHYNCIGMLLKAVQELSAENKELRKRIEKLESK